MATCVPPGGGLRGRGWAQPVTSGGLTTPNMTNYRLGTQILAISTRNRQLRRLQRWRTGRKGNSWRSGSARCSESRRTESRHLHRAEQLIVIIKPKIVKPQNIINILRQKPRRASGDGRRCHQRGGHRHFLGSVLALSASVAAQLAKVKDPLAAMTIALCGGPTRARSTAS